MSEHRHHKIKPSKIVIGLRVGILIVFAVLLAFLVAGPLPWFVDQDAANIERAEQSNNQ
jgi:hypothetical protein